MVVFTGFLCLTGVEGKMFHPMAFTVVAAFDCGNGAVGNVYPGRRLLFYWQQYRGKEKWCNQSDSTGLPVPTQLDITS